MLILVGCHGAEQYPGRPCEKMSDLPNEKIRVFGARQHNLKNLQLEIPRGKLVAITGVSGSGKSSLAFDTLYAEGRRRYVESLSVTARQFLERIEKPDVDRIEGLSPAIALEQRADSPGPRSTVGTSTEIHDYLRLIFAAAGTPRDPKTGRPLQRQTPTEIVDQLAQVGDATRVILLAPLVRNKTGTHEDLFERIRRDGFTRARVDGEILDLSSLPDGRPKLAKSKPHTIELVVDRIVLREGIRARLADSVETALRWGAGSLAALHGPDGSTTEARFSIEFRDPLTGYTRPPPTPRDFSFFSPHGACPVCHGLGTMLEPDPDLIVPDRTKSLNGGAIEPWSAAPDRMQPFYRAQLRDLAAHFGASLDTPFADLSPALQDALLNGSGDTAIAFAKSAKQPFAGLIAQLATRWQEATSEAVKARLRRCLAPRPCPGCGGARLKPESLAVTLADESGRSLNIQAVSELTIEGVAEFVAHLAVEKLTRNIIAEPLRQMQARLEFLREVGLEYLTLARETGTLSGGEAQRVRLATQIGGGLSGVLYVLDEPSIGLHPRDNDRLIATLRRLRDLGNSVLVVEHDEAMIRAADEVLEIGPAAGAAGGKLLAQGSLEDLRRAPVSPTADFLFGRRHLAPPPRRLPSNDREWLVIRDAHEHNLQHVTVRIPLGSLVCVTGVSGSGKSTLVDEILRRALFQHFRQTTERPGRHAGIDGLDRFSRVVVIDQAPIGRSPRSNPATYTGMFGLIRDLFAKLPAARARGFTASRFSFNVKGGRCERCGGDGQIKVEMQFLPDVHVTCEACEGRRFNRETLEVTFKGKSIADVLAMSIDEAGQFFGVVPGLAPRLAVLSELGLGYLALGQSADTLSGGEAQRLKLATELMKTPAAGHAIYLLDEPTTGLHLADMEKLLGALVRLRDAGHTLVVVEHHPDFILCADWVIDLGPEAGERGGRVVASGPPEAIAANPASFTGHALAEALARR
jgi:excinuclease ABC subunit A